MERNLAIIVKAKNTILFDKAMYLLEIYSTNTLEHVQNKGYTNVFTSALFLTANELK